MTPTGRTEASPTWEQFYSLGLIGYPLGQSLSPEIHKAALETLGLRGDYYLYPLPPTLEGRDGLEDLIEGVRTAKISGLNVTIPHKSTIIPLLDVLTPTAKAIGAVNTVYLDGDRAIGDNTDAPGFWRDAQRALQIPSHPRMKKRHAVILGAGGSARAAAYALLEWCYHITIAARRKEQAKAIRDQFPEYDSQITVVDLIDLQGGLTGTGDEVLVVNATPVGMYPRVDESPWPRGVPFPKDSAFYDLVYNPKETLLVRQARDAGLRGITGLGMLVEQAALAFQLWTGMEAPREVMMEAAEESLKLMKMESSNRTGELRS
jgi:shikimate dehydrogenase